MPTALELSGQRFGRLTVVRREGSLHGRSAWLCACDCGNTHLVPASSLVNNLTTSCGCWRREKSPRNAKRQQVVKYRMAHQRVVLARGVASAHTCIDCGLPAHEWSYDHADPNQLMEQARRGPVAYSLDPRHYVPRCRPCHRVFDTHLAQTA